jgi:hypothetical protein
MTLRAVSRWLSRQFFRVAMQVSPREREEWAQAMSGEVWEHRKWLVSFYVSARAGLLASNLLRMV